jgi:integrase
MPGRGTRTGSRTGSLTLRTLPGWSSTSRAARHYTASQLLAGGFDLRNTAARLGHSGGGATTLRHYADPVPEVDRRAAAYLAQLTAGSATQNGQGQAQ